MHLQRRGNELQFKKSIEGFNYLSTVLRTFFRFRVSFDLDVGGEARLAGLDLYCASDFSGLRYCKRCQWRFGV